MGKPRLPFWRRDFLRAACMPAEGMAAEPIVWNLDDIGADLARCGKAGSPTNVAKVQSVILAGGEYRAFDPTEAGVRELVGSLVKDHTLG